MRGDIIASRKRPRVAYTKFHKEQTWPIPCDGGHKTTAPVASMIVGGTLLAFCRPCWARLKAAIAKMTP